MIKDALVDLVTEICAKKSETQNIEVKSANKGCPKRLYDTLSSFSNQDNGGIIVFGIDEEQGFIPVGVYDLHDLQKKVTEQCKEMEPPVRAIFTIAEYEGKNVCAAEIPGLDITERPCYYKGVGRLKGSYIRVGDADLQMTDYELYSYEAYRHHSHDDIRPVPDAAMEFIDQTKLQGYLFRMREERPKFSSFSDEQAMEMLAITKNNELTLAAVLNFGIYPQGYFPQLAITAVVVKGKEIGWQEENKERFVNNKRIDGSLTEMLQEAISFCRRNMKVSTIIDPQTGERKDETEYPIEAIREIVVNALIHRDYSVYTEGTPIQINFFDDRLEVHSPGNLYGKMTVEQLGHTRPDLRNPNLAIMAEFLMGTENRYSGIPTIRKEMKKALLPEPKFENKRNEFVVTLYNQKEEIDINDTEPVTLLEFCETPKTRREIATFLGIDTVNYVMRHYIQPLVDEGKLAMTNPDVPRSKNQKFVKVK